MADRSPDSARILASWKQLSIVGFGLIGRSIAEAVRARAPHVRIIAVEREAGGGGSLAAAEPFVDAVLPASAADPVLASFASSDLVVLATPVSVIIDYLPLALREAPLVTDCGSTKRDIVAVARSLPHGERFVPGHPMAGAGGHATSSADLFEDRSWIVCPEGADPGALADVEAFVAALGASPVRLSAAEHDRAVAWTSHTPRIVASALVNLAGRDGASAAAGPAFERLLRGAGGSPAVWSDVLTTNADEIAQALRQLIRALDDCATELEASDAKRRIPRTLETLAAAESARDGFELPRGVRKR